MTDSVTRDVIPLRTATKAWFLISLQTFGGPAGQIAVMQRTLVDEKRWIGQQRFLHALNYCMLLPGPEAQQLAIYVGWLLNGRRGGLIAGTLFVLPGMLALLALSAIYVAFGATTAVTAVLAGLAPAVVAIVVQAVVRVGKRALHHPSLVALAAGAFLALALFAVPFPVVIAVAALLGWGLSRLAPAAFATAAKNGDADGPAPLISDETLHHEQPSLRRGAAVLGVGLLLWTAPVVVVAVLTGTGSTLTTQGVFFSGTALVTFGGAYAVLAFVAQRAVEVYGWLSAGDMVRGLALAESTPGPLIMVVQFVAFLGAYANPGNLDPWVAGVIGALLTTWVTFVPCFLFILLGAPYVERLRHNRGLGRRHRQPRPLLRPAHPVQGHHDAPRGPAAPQPAGVGELPPRGRRDHRHRAGPGLRPALADAAGPRRLRRAGSRRRAGRAARRLTGQAGSRPSRVERR
jgi:chromate transporter